MTKVEYGNVEEYVVLEVVEDLLDGLAPEDQTFRGYKFDVLLLVRKWQKEVGCLVPLS